MFIRKKRINGTEYAYLVQNTWTEKGSRQKSTKYLGKIISLGEVGHEFTYPTKEESAEEFLYRMLHSLLKATKFTTTDNKLYTLGEITVNIERKTVLMKGRPAVLEINEGFLCSLTLDNLMHFGQKKYSVELQEKHLHPGKVLAQRLLECGLKVTPEQFVLTFEFLVPNADVLLKYMYE